ncbi:hypothetical protein PAXRUDRAFT_835843 [Paxillus rubicundulus Ve08.2h10]|uniref:Uncharacterized protein n=1 Tax=Paxillus rubicundulus Ve08.2h10 TaxID=930991 RepID=A0A0D0DCE7_9AGAM|nr:hypothetical protein PAXRUDRAFT_835843 [Paxillus rubicundulus Ve08.2h10]
MEMLTGASEDALLAVAQITFSSIYPGDRLERVFEVVSPRAQTCQAGQNAQEIRFRFRNEETEA